MNRHSLESVADAGAAVATGVENAVRSAAGSGADLAEYTGRQAAMAGSEVAGFVRRNPIASLGGALAFGVFAGLVARRRIFD